MQEIHPNFKESLKRFEGHNFLKKKIAENVKIKLYQAGEKVFVKRDVPDFAYLILHGKLGFYDTYTKHQKQCLNQNGDVSPSQRSFRFQKAGKTIKNALKFTKKDEDLSD